MNNDDVINIGVLKKCHPKCDDCSIQIDINRGDIAVVYSKLVYKLKAINDKDDTKTHFPIRYNNSA